MLTIIENQIMPVLENLDWAYIVGMIFINMILQSVESDNRWINRFPLKKRIKVALVGLLYAPLHYFAFNLQQADIGWLLISFLATFALHKLIADAVIRKIREAFPVKIFIYDKNN